MLGSLIFRFQFVVMTLYRCKKDHAVLVLFCVVSCNAVPKGKS